MIVTKSVSLDHNELNGIDEMIKNGKYDNFSQFVRQAIRELKSKYK